ncbi:MAG: hypothetical protein QOG54_1117 [Actinomycetota bacterium]|nr:hypothetical protein [Actinomycetota bacterium]
MDDPTMEPEETSEVPTRSVHRHELDPISLAFGAIFATIGIVFLVGDVDASLVNGAWGWAALFGVTGLLLLAVGVRLQRR